MGSKYPVLSSDEVIAALKKADFQYKSQRGSHVKYVKEGRPVIIPVHKEIAKGTLKSILMQAGMELDDFMKLL